MGHIPNSTATKRKSNKSKLGLRKNDGNASPESCDECNKTFHSRMALYGHMRIHRNRYRHVSERPPEPSPSRSTTTTAATTIVIREEEHDVATSLLLLAHMSLVDVKKIQEPNDGDEEENNNNVLRVLSPGSGNPNGCDMKRPVLDLNLPPPLEKADHDTDLDLELRLGR